MFNWVNTSNKYVIELKDNDTIIGSLQQYEADDDYGWVYCWDTKFLKSINVCELDVIYMNTGKERLFNDLEQVKYNVRKKIVEELIDKQAPCNNITHSLCVNILG